MNLLDFYSIQQEIRTKIFSSCSRQYLSCFRLSAWFSFIFIFFAKIILVYRKFWKYVQAKILLLSFLKSGNWEVPFPEYSGRYLTISNVHSADNITQNRKPLSSNSDFLSFWSIAFSGMSIDNTDTQNLFWSILNIDDTLRIRNKFFSFPQRIKLLSCKNYLLRLTWKIRFAG